MISKHLKQIVLLLSFMMLVQSALRYRDDQMMQQHHQEPQQTAANLTIHLIPHSHDDVGWLKTVDNYFYGGDMRTQFAGVQYTIDTVVSQLNAHPQYKFSIVQMAFLYRWWNQATTQERQTMKRLVTNKQLQFINGGWCMSDEANMYYQDFIDQMTVGLRWLKQTLGQIPDVAWHIDPFGHHAASASLFSQLGFQAFFFARIDYQDKAVRLSNKSMQMVWRPLQYSNDNSNYMFTHVNYYHYSPPPGFCFDDVCRDEPIKDDPTLQDYNIVDRAQKFVDYFKSMSNHYRTSNLLHTLGQDFQYTNSRMWYKNVDKLIKYINSKPQFGMTIKYSTPTQYIAAIKKQDVVYPNKYDDFFPYADNAHSMWTGYFVSRVALKGFVKDVSRYAQTVRKHISQLKMSNVSNVIKNSGRQVQQKIFGLQMALGILQHHDAVAGTAKQKVTNDYIFTGYKAVSDLNKLYTAVRAEQIKSQTGQNVNPTDIYVNLYWNESGISTGLDNLSKNKSILVSLYNPGPNGVYPIRLRVPQIAINIVGTDNKPIVGDVFCSNTYDTNNCDLTFSISISASSNGYVKLVPSSTGSAQIVLPKQLTVIQQIKTFSIGQDQVKLTRGNQTFQLTLPGNNQSFKIGYNYYTSWDQNNQNSGAYIFRPLIQSSQQYSSIKKLYYSQGNTAVTVTLQGDKTLTKVHFSKTNGYVRNYGILIETVLDSISVDDGKGKEVVLNVQTDYKNYNNTFYTDSMGLEEQKRIIDYRPTWNYQVNQPISGNYYPVNSFIRLADGASNRSATLMTDRSQGGMCNSQGLIQLMIHRRLLKDDGRGVQQPLNQFDTDGKGLRQVFRHYLIFSNKYRQVQKLNDQRVLPFFSPTTLSTFQSVSPKVGKYPIQVPSSVKLYLRPYLDGTYLLRLHNMDTLSSASVQIYAGWVVQQYTLAVNQLKSAWKSKQYQWKQQKNIQQQDRLLFEDINIKVPHFNLKRNSKNDANITLKPFQLKAFILKQA